LLKAKLLKEKETLPAFAGRTVFAIERNAEEWDLSFRSLNFKRHQLKSLI